MNRVSQKAMNYWMTAGARFLPFADAATPDLPLSRLLRLSLFQVSVGMALVLLVGTLNRVMIVELDVPASLVGIMIALPLVFAPFRALIGFRSDTHTSALGWRRAPFIFRGSMLQFGGLAIMPFALLVLSGGGEAHQVPGWVGCAAAGLAFLLTGAGLHTTQTVGLALATDLAPQESQPNVVGLMYVMLLLGMIVSALLFGTFLADFTPFRLVQVIQATALATVVLNTLALWKQEGRDRARMIAARAARPSFAASWERFMQGSQALRRLSVIGIGTMAFSMEDVLLEPYGGQILHLSVGQTTRLTATLALGGLFGFWLASRILSRGTDPFRMARAGGIAGVAAFSCVILAAPCHSLGLFAFGTLLIGFGAGLFGHGTLTATMQLAPRNQSGLALGAWGAVQATAAGIAIAMGGIIRDVVARLSPHGPFGAATGYDFVYSLEVGLLLVTLLTMLPLFRPATETSKKYAKGRISMKLSRFYTDIADAKAAEAELLAAGFGEDQIELVSKDAGYVSAETLSDRGAAKLHAAKYAEAIKAGGVLLMVNPPLGSGQMAEDILEKSRGVETTATPLGYEGEPWDEAAPLSSAMMIPVLLDNPTPLSTLLNIPTLTAKRGFLFGGKLIDNPAPFSSLFGAKLLSDNPAPLSSLLKLKVLTGK